jgi:predicted metallo-beta-lactamase superfamily hydrolase
MLPVWDRSVVFLRWADEAVLIGLTVALGARRFPIRPVLRGVSALWLTTALVWISV